MARRIRNFEPGTTLEITSRTIQSRFLLKPTKMVTLIILGVLGRATAKYGIHLHGFVFLSNHFHLIVTIPNVESLSLFMNYLKGNIAKECGKIFGWKEKFWGRRYTPIPILDDAALVERLEYVLEQGCKENLVDDPRKWPGATCVNALIDGTTPKGFWFNRTAEYNARRAGKEFGTFDFAEEVIVPLTPIPCWADLSAEEYQARILDTVEEITRSTKARHRAIGTRPMDTKKITAQHPHSKPEASKKSPSPSSHASTRARRKAFIRQYRAFLDEYRESSRAWLAGVLDVEFPLFCFKPPLTSANRGDPSLFRRRTTSCPIRLKPSNSSPRMERFA